MKYLLSFSLVFCLACPVLAGEDGVSRYEAAALISAEARSVNRGQAVIEKNLEEIKNEVALLSYQKEKSGRENHFSGLFEADARVSLTDPRGGRMQYRLVLDLEKEFDPASSLKINLDTMDAGFGTDAVRDPATRMIDLCGQIKQGETSYVVIIGPGKQAHTESGGFMPSEDHTYYVRPNSGLEITRSVGKMDLSAAYVARQVATSGKIGVNELTGKINYDFGRLELSLRPRYIFILDGTYQVLAEAGLKYAPDPSWATEILAGVGSFHGWQNGSYLKFAETINDPFKTGTSLVLRFDKVGADYRRDDLEPTEFIKVNNFDRLILDGTADLGLALKQSLSGPFFLEYKMDYVTDNNYNYGAAYPGTYSLWQAGLEYVVSPRFKARAYYRYYNVPSGTAQFSLAVPTVSAMVGAGVACAF